MSEENLVFAKTSNNYALTMSTTLLEQSIENEKVPIHTHEMLWLKRNLSSILYN